MSPAQRYGQAPQIVEPHLDLSAWTEFMHYLYLPVVMPEAEGILAFGVIRLPENLEFLRSVIEDVCDHERVVDDGGDANAYVYVTARRGFAAPGNPLNRPGWHADGFGTDDVNYIWSDAYPTQIAAGTMPVTVSTDHVRSARQFDTACEAAKEGRVDSTLRVYDAPVGALLRLDPYVLHSVPVIPPPGGERAFLKISVSTSRYNLRGNSHNHAFDYDWTMHDRAVVRNDPAWAGGDSYEGDVR